MNLATRLVPTSTEFEVVRGQWSIMTPSDFPEGCGVIFNPDTGEQFGIGKNALGSTIKARLYTPLCQCGEVINGNICDSCYVIHADLPGGGE